MASFAFAGENHEGDLGDLTYESKLIDGDQIFKNKDLSPDSTFGSKDSTRRGAPSELELESFGYTFLRINKFSLLPRRTGETPADVLNAMLERAFS